MSQVKWTLDPMHSEITFKGKTPDDQYRNRTIQNL